MSGWTVNVTEYGVIEEVEVSKKHFPLLGSPSRDPLGKPDRVWEFNVTENPSLYRTTASVYLT